MCTDISTFVMILSGSSGQLFKFLHVEVGATHNERHKPIRSSLRRAEPKRPPHKCRAAFFFLCLHIATGQRSQLYHMYVHEDESHVTVGFLKGIVL